MMSYNYVYNDNEYNIETTPIGLVNQTVVGFEDRHYGAGGDELFYRTAVINNAGSRNYHVVAHWGRVGAAGSFKHLSNETSPNIAVAAAKGQIESKERQGKGWKRYRQGAMQVKDQKFNDQEVLDYAFPYFPNV